VTETDRKITESIERGELSRGRLPEGAEPVEPRPAATVVLGRDAAAGGYEVLLLRRPHTARFAAGAYVFPGGVIDPEDEDPALVPVLPAGREPAAMAAGLRELFEETGLLLSDPALAAGEEAEERAALLGGRRGFGQILRDRGLRLDGGRVAYIARWVTPVRFSRRYDTRFFLARLPEERAGFEPDLTDELVGWTWLTPGEAIERFREGRLPMLFPTRTTLDALARHADLDALFAWAAAERVNPVTPRLLIRGETVRPVLPGDPDYDAASD
jgi:8-oxo-dGTP pyrophosphatase MutT (NUDIX family)